MAGGLDLYREGRRLEWYGVLVRNHSVLGSLFTLLHLPFMGAFLSMVSVGTIAIGSPNIPVLALSLLVVALILYGEHMLDDTTLVGKPWGTVFNDAALLSMAVLMFAAASGVGLLASLWLSSPLPILGVLAGIVFSVLYGLEVLRFHTIGFGAIGMGVIPTFSYLAQAISSSSAVSVPFILLLLAFGCAYSYVLLSLYEHTKIDGYHENWKLLAFHFAGAYALAAMILLSKLG